MHFNPYNDFTKKIEDIGFTFIEKEYCWIKNHIFIHWNYGIVHIATTNPTYLHTECCMLNQLTVKYKDNNFEDVLKAIKFLENWINYIY